MDASPTDNLAAPVRPGEYVVVARRYRPTTFDELIGQGHVAQALANAIRSGRVGHAYLFTGARGVGKTSAARILAKALNCVHGPTPTPCNECDICTSIARGEDVDVLEIDGASNRGIDEIRQLRQNAGVRPSRARFKIYIIDEVHMLTKEAFNALLKTLEEPPEHVKFIFATTEPNKIPITILSRCQRFDFAGIDATDIETRLRQIAEAEGVEAEAEALQLIARRAGGSMRDSQSLLEQLLSISGKKIGSDDVTKLLGAAPAVRLGEMVRSLVAHDAATALAVLDAAVEQGVEVAQLIDQLLGYFRDMMAASVGCEEKLWLHVMPAQQSELKQHSGQLGIETILAIIQILEQTAGRMRISTHGRILAETALVRVAKLEDLDQLTTLIDSLASGEPGASNGARVAPQSGRPAPEPLKKNDRTTAEPPVTTAPRTAPHAETAAPSRAAAPDVADAICFQKTLTAESAAIVWRHVVDNLGELVADQARLSERVAWAAPDRLAVSFPAKYTSCRQFCEAPEQRAKLEAALAVAAGAPVRLEFETLPDTAEPTAPQRSTLAARRQLQAEVTARPIVRRAMELFEVEQPRVDVERDLKRPGPSGRG